MPPNWRRLRLPGPPARLDLRRDLPPGAALSDTEPSKLARALYAALPILPCLWAIGYFWPPLNHDAGALLQFADRMVGGERLYVDLIDINPPMVMWLDMIPASLARATGLSLPAALVGFLLTLFGLTLIVAWRIADELFDPRAQAALRRALPPIALFAALVYPAYSFAQREHLMFVFALPYLLTAAARLTGQPIDRKLVLAAAAIVGLAIDMKPHFAAIPGLIELYLILSLGWRRALRDPTPWVIGAIGSAYVALVLILCPAYLDFIVPLVMRYYATETGQGLGEMLLGDQLPGVLALLAPLSYLAFRRAGAPLARIVCLATIGASASAILQHKGWDYHFLAARSLSILLLAVTLADLFDRQTVAAATPNRPTQLALALTLAASLFFLSGNLSPPFKAQREFAQSPAGKILPIVEREAKNQPVLWLTSSIYPQFPVLDYANSKLAMPFMSLWLLPAIYDDAPIVGNRFVYTPPDAMGPAEALVFRSVASDMARLKPALILTPKSGGDSGFHGHRFDYLEYFGRNPVFAAELAHYRLLTEESGLAIYKRVSP
jgi:hypothetical protein